VDASARDFHIRPNSAAADRAIPSSNTFALFDLDGVDRGIDGQRDLGCYEVTP